MARENENSSNLAQESLSRRDLLLRVSRWLLGSAGVVALAAVGRFLRPGISAGALQSYPIGRLSDFRVGTLTWLRGEELFVWRDETGLGAFSARCTHLGCIIRRTAEGFLCPCHGARYDARGQVLSGPARRPLPWYRVWLEADGRIWVDVGSEVAPEPSPLAHSDQMLGVTRQAQAQGTLPAKDRPA
jgi:nitrite reductase/ring-hydroxylating ferredoxin subunit